MAKLDIWLGFTFGSWVGLGWRFDVAGLVITLGRDYVLLGIWLGLILDWVAHLVGLQIWLG